MSACRTVPGTVGAEVGEEKVGGKGRGAGWEAAVKSVADRCTPRGLLRSDEVCHSVVASP